MNRIAEMTNLFRGTPILEPGASECVKKNTSSKDAIVASHWKQSPYVSCLVSGHLDPVYMRENGMVLFGTVPNGSSALAITREHWNGSKRARKL